MYNINHKAFEINFHILNIVVMKSYLVESVSFGFVHAVEVIPIAFFWVLNQCFHDRFQGTGQISCIDLKVYFFIVDFVEFVIVKGQ